MSGSLVYNNTKVTSAVSEIKKVGNTLSDVSEDLNRSINQLKTATGFQLVGSYGDFGGVPNIVENCKTAVDGLVSTIRVMQAEILQFNGSEEDITAFIRSLSKEDIENAPEILQEMIVRTATLSDKALQIFESTGATLLTGVSSLLEGLLGFGEKLVDGITLFGTAVASIGTGLWDGVNRLFGNESNATEKMWDATKSFVSKEGVKSLFDSMYDNTEFGMWMKENAYGFDTVRSVGNGI